MSDVLCTLNAGMERVILASTPDGSSIDISKHADYHIYFDLLPGASEQRQLRVVSKSTQEEVLTVNLNNKGGLKPADGTTTPYKPDQKPLIIQNFPVSTEDERIFFADTNLSATSGITVTFKIVPFDENIDKRRYLTFSSSRSDFPRAIAGEEFDLNDPGGKKPLGGAGALKP